MDKRQTLTHEDLYVRLARAEERDVAAEFGPAWTAYAALTPGFIPRRRRTNAPSPRPPAAHSEEVRHR